MTKPWLVTGAAGFIGSNLCEHLLASGIPVVGLDNFFTGHRRNVERLQAAYPGLFRFIEGDIREADATARAAAGCDVVTHLAAQVSVQRSIDDPAETNGINVDGFLGVYAAALKRGARSFVYASSCSVYGDNPDLPLDETSRTAPLSPYAASKLADELYADALGRLNPAMRVVGLRFFNVYGPWQDHNGGYAAVIPRWIAALMAGQRPVIFGDGSATRDFVFVKDVCQAVRSASRHDNPAEPAVFNVASATRTSILDLYRAIAGVVGETGRAIPFDGPEFLASRPGDILHSVADIGRIETVLGYRPNTRLRDGLTAILRRQWQAGPANT